MLEHDLLLVRKTCVGVEQTIGESRDIVSSTMHNGRMGLIQLSKETHKA